MVLSNYVQSYNKFYLAVNVARVECSESVFLKNSLFTFVWLQANPLSCFHLKKAMEGSMKHESILFWLVFTISG